MVTFIYGGPAPSCNDVTASAPSFAARHVAGATVHAGDLSALHPDIIDDPLLTPDDQFAVLAHLDAEVVTTLGDLAGLLARHPCPVRAVLLMVERGVLAIDRSAPFDAATKVCRADPRCG